MDLIGKYIQPANSDRNRHFSVVIFAFYNVVSIGGTLGLFLGVSLLSIVEIIYYFVVWNHRKPVRGVEMNVKSQKRVCRPVDNVNNLPFLH